MNANYDERIHGPWPDFPEEEEHRPGLCGNCDSQYLDELCDFCLRERTMDMEDDVRDAIDGYERNPLW